MRKLLLLLAATAGLAVTASANAATRNVTITERGFAPANLTIATGDTVRWRNADTVRHQVVATNGAFASPVLLPGRSYAFTFRTAGRYPYRDALRPALRGTVTVTGPPPSVSIAASEPIIVYGTQIRLSGTVSSRRAGEQVRIFSQPYPQASFAEVAIVVTTTGGTWDYLTTPRILTAYRATWRGRTSATVTTGVQPRITLRRTFVRGKRYFVVKAVAGRSLAGRVVSLQRRSRFGEWVTIKRVRLRTGSSRRFRVNLRRGVSRLRIFMTVNQAGAGYLAGYSRTLTVRTR